MEKLSGVIWDELSGNIWAAFGLVIAFVVIVAWIVDIRVERRSANVVDETRDRPEQATP